MWESLPQFGTGVLYAILIAAAYTFAVSLLAGKGRPRLLQSARLGAYGTCALVLLGVLILAYAFVSHDFRIRYVYRYSDRAMDPLYLLTSLSRRAGIVSPGRLRAHAHRRLAAGLSRPRSRSTSPGPISIDADTRRLAATLGPLAAERGRRTPSVRADAGISHVEPCRHGQAGGGCAGARIGRVGESVEGLDKFP